MASFNFSQYNTVQQPPGGDAAGAPAFAQYGGGGGGDFGMRTNDRMGNLGANLRDINWQREDLGRIQRPDWRPHPMMENRSREEIYEWKQSHSIQEFTNQRYRELRPMLTFEESGFPGWAMDVFRHLGFRAPTPIQSVMWPIILEGNDGIGIAKTGSGKTFAFAVPGVLALKEQPPLRRGDGPIMLALAPTRELACQIEDEFRKIGSACNVRACCVYGGASKGPQIRALSSGCEMVIACPGRLIDMIESRYTDLRRVTYLVLDEADRMLDMGFEPQIRTIIGQIRPDRQTVMFSATWPKEVQRLAHDYLRDPVRIHVGSMELTANPDVRQHIIFCEDHDKEGILQRMLKDLLKDQTKALVFTDTKRKCDNLQNDLARAGYFTVAMHGDKDQRQREDALRRFRNQRSAVLIATDVASRGLDIPDLDMVINFDFPGGMEDYVHRIGRTGRAGRKGDAISFFTKDSSKLAGELIQIIERAGQPVPDMLREYVALAGRYGGGNRRGMQYRQGGYQDQRRGAAPAPRFDRDRRY